MLNKIFTMQGSMLLPAFVLSSIVGLYAIIGGSNLKVSPLVGWLLILYSVYVLGCMVNVGINAKQNKKVTNGK